MSLDLGKKYQINDRTIYVPGRGKPLDYYAIIVPETQEQLEFFVRGYDWGSSKAVVLVGATSLEEAYATVHSLLEPAIKEVTERCNKNLLGIMFWIRCLRNIGTMYSNNISQKGQQ